MRTIYVIDTSVLFDHPELIQKLGNEWNAAVYIPRAVIRELDKLKDFGVDEKKQPARDAISAIRAYHGSDYINPDYFSTLHIGEFRGQTVGDMSKAVDNIIVSMAIELKKKFAADHDEVVILTKDGTMQLSASTHGIFSSGYPFKLYDVLRIPGRNKGEKEIKDAYHKIIHRYHPDHTGPLDLDELSNKYALQRSKDIISAYQKLQQNGYYNDYVDVREPPRRDSSTGTQRRQTPPPPRPAPPPPPGQHAGYGSPSWGRSGSVWTPPKVFRSLVLIVAVASMLIYTASHKKHPISVQTGPIHLAPTKTVNTKRHDKSSLATADSTKQVGTPIKPTEPREDPRISDAKKQLAGHNNWELGTAVDRLNGYVQDHPNSAEGYYYRGLLRAKDGGRAAPGVWFDNLRYAVNDFRKADELAPDKYSDIARRIQISTYVNGCAQSLIDKNGFKPEYIKQCIEEAESRM